MIYSDPVWVALSGRDLRDRSVARRFANASVGGIGPAGLPASCPRTTNELPDDKTAALRQHNRAFC